MGIMVEIVEFRIQKTVSAGRFQEIVDGLEREFHTKLPGFLSSELLYREKEDTWIILQHWASLDQLQAASKQMFEAEETILFREALQTQTVKMTILPQLQQWER